MSTIDFIVLGMARNGTTSVSGYLSATDNIHCGKEIFTVYDDHSKVHLPDSYVERAQGETAGLFAASDPWFWPARSSRPRISMR